MKEFFKHIIGHEFNVQHFQSLAKNRRVPHALLFIGKDGIGKRTVAEAFARMLVAGEDENLVSQNAITPDVHIIERQEDKKDISVDAMRALSSRLQLKPYAGKVAVAIIDDAHRMSISAANALLTTLEEPPSYAHLILTTSAPNKLPETIISRCQPIYFSDLSAVELERILSSIIQDSECLAISKNLLNYLDGSLSPLLLDEHLEQHTHTVNQLKLSEHFQRLVEKYQQLSTTADKILKSSLAAEMAELTCAVTAITSDKDEMNLIWPALYRQLRTNLRAQTRSTEDTNKLSTMLASTLNAEYLVSERNANAQLQLFSAFSEN